MNYKVIDFRSLVTLWYNEFLPERMGDKSVFVEGAGILYLKSIPLKSIKKDTVKFLGEKSLALSGTGIGLVVQEPKPVNNVRIQPLLRFIEGMKGMSTERRDKVLHFANRRYVPLSSDIMVSQDKEIDEFLDCAFKELGKRGLPPNVKLYPLQALGMSDFLDSARAFFPKKALSIQAVQRGKHIQVRSTNDMLEQLKSYVVNVGMDASATNYIASCKKTLDKDMEALV